MALAHRTPLFSKSRFLFVLYAPVAIFGAIALAIGWTAWDVPGTLGLLWFEGVVLSLAVVLAEPERFHWAGRVLLGLVGAMALVLAFLPEARGHLAVWELLVVAAPCVWYAAIGWFQPHADTSRDRETFCGRIEFADGRLVFRAESYHWELALEDVAAVGELTIEDLGPDHFLCFVSKHGAKWDSVPATAAGMREVLPRLEAFLGMPLDFALANRTDFASRVMWPPHLVERPLFALGAERRSRIPFLPGGREFSLDPSVVAELRR